MVEPISLFPNQLPKEPTVSLIFTSSFDCPNNGIYKAARRQNYSRYEEGRDRLLLIKTEEGIAGALKRL